MATKSEFIQEMQDLVVAIIEATTGEELTEREGLDNLVLGIADRTYDEIAVPGVGSGTDKEVFTSITNLIANEASSEVFTFTTIVLEKFPSVTVWWDEAGTDDWHEASGSIRVEPVSTTQIQILNSTGTDIPAGRVKLTVVG